MTFIHRPNIFSIIYKPVKSEMLNIKIWELRKKTSLRGNNYCSICLCYSMQYSFLSFIIKI